MKIYIDMQTKLISLTQGYYQTSFNVITYIHKHTNLNEYILLNELSNILFLNVCSLGNNHYFVKLLFYPLDSSEERYLLKLHSRMKENKKFFNLNFKARLIKKAALFPAYTPITRYYYIKVHQTI